MKGQYEHPLSQEEKDRFLDLIAQGYPRPKAAEALDRTARKFRALCNPASPYYDEEFANRYQRLTEPGGEHEEAVVERVEAAFIERAVKESDRAAEKVLAARSARYAFLRPQSFKGQVSIEQVKIYLQGVTDETLDRMIEEAKRGELPPGTEPIIDAA